MKPQNGNGKRRGRKIPEVLTADEQARLLALVDGQDTSSLRGRAILRLLLDTGLRASELINLRVRDFDWETGRFMVREGKGGKDRALCLSDEDLSLLKQYSSSKLLEPNGAHVFTSLDGKKPLCGRWLRRWVKRLGEQASIVKNIHLHLFRHTLACDLLRKTNSLKVVQDTLGHEDISTTTIYARLVNHEVEHALKNLRKENP